MSTPSPQADAQELNGILSRINHLGAATEHLFSRLYQGLGRRSRQSGGGNTQKLGDQNRQLQRAVRKRDIEIERLSSILAALDEGIIMQDTEGRIVLVNKAARLLLGTQKSFWESELATLFNAHRHVTDVDSELAPLGEPTKVQVNNRILGAQLAAVGDSEGKRLGTMIVLRDVTKDALSDRLKDQFITAISHELRTPMAVIKGMSEVLLGQPEDKKPNRRLLETLSRNVDILDRMIVELFDISELSSGRFSVREDMIDLEDLIWNVVNGMSPEIRRSQLDVAVMIRDSGRLHIMGDEQRLRWALGHLLQNSLRYTEPSGHIIVTAALSDGQHIGIQVVDTGVGISEKDLPHVFERFYRGEPRTQGGKLLDPRGLGQGLFIARTVAEAHRGYLGVQSQQGQGSIFTMVLPAAF
jgi:two-component system, OmpR family, phosphate regulon sensor histidine kinase PhoR